MFATSVSKSASSPFFVRRLFRGDTRFVASTSFGQSSNAATFCRHRSGNMINYPIAEVRSNPAFGICSPDTLKQVISSRTKFRQCSITAVATTGLYLRSSEAKFENIPKRLHTILPVCLFPFSVGPPEVTDAKLINAKTTLPRNLRANLDFDSEIIRSQSQ